MQSRGSLVRMPTMALGKRSTAKDVIDAFSPNLKGKTAVVTGGNSGIGTETVKALASAGCRVILCSRNVQAGEEAAEVQIKASQGREIKDGYSVPDADIKVLPLDLADLASVELLAKELESEESIDFLVLNAGVMIGPKGYTKDGFERQIGTNHFGHFYLTELLLPRMKQQETTSR
jgi:NAD(P)-dependent dehydrogenase (short-subunit alcohol dehydrogenase family)